MSRSSREELILFLSTAPKREVRKQLEDRVLGGLCLRPSEDRTDCNEHAVKNGWCVKCDAKIRYFILSNRMTHEEEQRFLAKLEREGKRCPYQKRKEIIRNAKRKAAAGRLGA